jgi:hypothetical protein
MTFTRALSTNNYGPAKFIVDGTTTANGTHSTIQAAITSASSGDTIFIRPGTYTEHLTLKVGVNLTAYGSDSSQNGTGKVIISGTCTLTTAGTVTISGIQLQTNSAALLAVTGTLASVVNIDNCYLNCTNNTGITFSSSSASATINIKNSAGDLGTTGIAIFSDSSAGNLNIYDSDFTNSGASTTANTVSAGLATFRRVRFMNPVTTSSSGGATGVYTQINCNATNATALTHNGSDTTSTFIWCNLLSGTASAVSIGGTLSLYQSAISSSNTNAITGAGSLNYGDLSFTSTSQTINTTTQGIAGTSKGSTTTAPTAGYLGEQIRNYAQNQAITSTTTINITSISLTAGVWDVSANVVFGGSTGITAGGAAITSTSATMPNGTAIGDNQQNFTNSSTGFTACSLSIPSFRVTLASTTTYYLAATLTWSAGAGVGSGRISGTRVG